MVIAVEKLQNFLNLFKLSNSGWPQETRMMGLRGEVKKCDDIFSRLSRIDKFDRRTDGQTPADSWYRAYA